VREVFARSSSVLLGVFATVLAVAAAPASAEYIHGPSSAEFGPTGGSSPGFGNLNTLAYQQAEKKLYALADNSIYGFSNPSAGTLTPLGGSFPIGVSSSSQDSDIAVDNSATGSAGHIIYNADGPNIVGYTSGGSSLGFTINTGSENCGVAVDNEGHIWGGNYGNENMGEWPAAGGSAIATFPLEASVGRPCKIGVDNSNNDVYPSSYGNSNVAKYTKASGYSSFSLLAAVPSSNARIAVNAVRHVLYLGGPNSNNVASYDTATGSLLETFTIPEGNVKGIAVQDSSDTVFLAGSNGKIYELRGISVPKSTTGEPTGNSSVGGTADADGAGEITECFFEFGEHGAGEPSPYGSVQNCNQTHITQGESPKAVEAALPGLAGETTYHYRLVLGNANGQAKGVDKTITPHNVKQTKTEDATEVTRTTARLNGSFEGTNQATTYYFDYGTSTSYGSRIPLAPAEESAGTTTGTTPMSLVVSGLKPDTTYHFRVVAKNELGISPGKDKSFHTPLAVEGVTTEGASDITKTTAVLHGSYTGNGEPHTFKFEYGETTAYGNVIEGTAPTGTGKLLVSAEVEGLQVQLPTSQPYHYRLVMTNATGSTIGSDRTFKTEPPDVPVISAESSEGVTPTKATLNATINPGEGETVYVFEYGPDNTYGSATPISPSIGNDTGDHEVSNELTGLTPGTTYHYRAVAINFSGTAHGEDLTFTTPDVPGIESSGVSGVTRSSAHLTMAVTGNASPTEAHFEYGPTAAYGISTAPSSVGSSLLSVPATADITGLSAGTTYHYRAVAVNAIGATTGPDQTFTTLPPEQAQEEERRPPHCRKGFVRRHGKCVKRHHRKHKRHHHRRHG
jgi:phosphodiesterase/alkaline phosphatase D-like protein